MLIKGCPQLGDPFLFPRDAARFEGMVGYEHCFLKVMLFNILWEDNYEKTDYCRKLEDEQDG